MTENLVEDGNLTSNHEFRELSVPVAICIYTGKPCNPRSGDVKDKCLFFGQLPLHRPRYDDRCCSYGENQHVSYVPKEKPKEAVALILQYGGIDGDHHRCWVLKQVLRILLGDEEYERKKQQTIDEGYGWDEGIPP